MSPGQWLQKLRSREPTSDVPYDPSSDSESIVVGGFIRVLALIEGKKLHLITIGLRPLLRSVFTSVTTVY